MIPMRELPGAGLYTTWMINLHICAFGQITNAEPKAVFVVPELEAAVRLANFVYRRSRRHKMMDPVTLIKYYNTGVTDVHSDRGNLYGSVYTGAAWLDEMIETREIQDDRVPDWNILREDIDLCHLLYSISR